MECLEGRGIVAVVCRNIMNENNLQPISNQPKKIKRLRVLISAYACEPGKGSEPGVWNFSKEMAKHHDLWVLTRLNNREIIENDSMKIRRKSFISFTMIYLNGLLGGRKVGAVCSFIIIFGN